MPAYDCNIVKVHGEWSPPLWWIGINVRITSYPIWIKRVISILTLFFTEEEPKSTSAMFFTKLTQNDRYDGLLELFFTSGRNFPSTFQCIEKMWRINPIGLCLRTKNRQVLENQDFRMHLTIRFGSNNDDWWYWLDDVIANINSELEKEQVFQPEN